MRGTTQAGLAALCLIAAAAGCSDDPTETTPRGAIEAMVSDDPSTTTAVAGAAALGSVTGSIVSSAAVEISNNGTDWVSLGAATGVTLALQSTSDSKSVYGSVQVPAGTYSKVRITLTNGQTNLLAGSIVDNVTLVANTTLTLGGGDATVVIEKDVGSFTVVNGSKATILVDLNSESWVIAQNVQDLVVDDVEVTTAASARVVVAAQN
jgi:hypothetical protein